MEGINALISTSSLLDVLAEPYNLDSPLVVSCLDVPCLPKHFDHPGSRSLDEAGEKGQGYGQVRHAEA